MKKRRGRGEGSIYQVRPGLWCGMLSQTNLGKRVRTAVYGKTKAEVADGLRRAMVREHAVPASSLTLGEWLDVWMREHIAASCRPGSIERYHSLIKCHMAGINGLRLAKVTPDALRSFLRDCREAGGSDALARSLYVLLRSALKIAVRRDLIPSNPADRVDPPRYEQKPVEALGIAEVTAFLKAIDGDRLEALYALAIMRGLRMSELFGLRWEDLDLKSDVSTLKVLRQLRELSDGSIVEVPTKSKNGVRLIVLPEHVRNAIAELAHKRTGPYVFTAAKGGPLRKSNFVRKEFKPLLRRHNLPDFNFHRLRHTAATLAAYAGNEIDVTSKMLGHSSSAVTSRIYTHFMLEGQTAAAVKTDALFAGLGGERQ